MLIRTMLLACFVITVAGTAFGQRPGPEFRRIQDCEYLEPRTKLEALETAYEKVLVKGFTQIANFSVRGADIRVDAVEFKENRPAGERALGLVIVLREQSETPRENRTFVDYDEIDRLLRALDAVTRVNETVTKLAGFEALYRTASDLEVRVFRQTRNSGTAASITNGVCNRIVALLTLDELERLKAHIVEAKTRLDEIK
ncbi:MAG TPA: hypothetical protein VJT50_07575 [Pyrinomonadaceae bacterium]|nr:hypothetical protein [Pyrinomonadaceae bacterium]